MTKGPAVRSAAVTSGMDVSTHPVHDTSSGEPGRSDAVPQTGATARSGPRRPARSSRAGAEGGADRRFPPPGPCLFHRSRRAPVVARLVRPPFFVADLWVRRSGAGGLVHGLAGLGHHPRAQRVLLGSRQCPARRQPALEHLGTARRRRAGSRHLALRSRRRHQRRADARTGSQRVGLFCGDSPSRQVEGGRHPRGAGVRLFVSHRHVDRLRPRVGDGPGDPALSVHHAPRDRDPPGALGTTRRPPPGRVAGRTVLRLARDPRDVPASGCRRRGGGHAGRLASAPPARRSRRSPPWGSLPV